MEMPGIALGSDDDIQTSFVHINIMLLWGMIFPLTNAMDVCWASGPRASQEVRIRNRLLNKYCSPRKEETYF